MSATKALLAAFFGATHRHRLATFAVIIVLIAEGVSSIGFRENDFEWHRKLGGHFLAGAPHVEGGQWYPLGRAMFDALPAAMNKYAARGLFYGLATAAIFWLAFRWNSLAGPTGENTRAGWTAALIAYWLSIALIQRDLDECGLQILLLFLLTAGLSAMQRGQALKTGFWLAAAVTYKSTPILFMPFLLWKRQWRAAVWMTVFIAIMNIAPAAYLGWTKMVEGNRQFVLQARKTGQLRDPSQNGVEVPKPQNQGLVAAGARYLMRFDATHPCYVDHPGYLHFGSLSPVAADRTIKIGLLMAAALLAWRFWPSEREREFDVARPNDFACQGAALCALCALLAPLCWKQHLVLTLPSLMLSIRGVLTSPHNRKTRIGVLVLIGLLMLGTGRELVGREGSFVLSAYKVHTIAALLSVGLVLTIPRRPAQPLSSEPSLKTRTKRSHERVRQQATASMA